MREETMAKPRDLTAWEYAYKMGHRVFYEPATQTIRQCPENYRLAIRSPKTRRWYADPDKASPINAHSLSIVLDKWQDGSTGGGLAEVIEIEFWGRRGTISEEAKKAFSIPD